MDRDEALRLIDEKLAREHAERNEANWSEGRVSLVLVRSPDDPAAFSREYQTVLDTLSRELYAADINVRSRVMALDSIESAGGQVGEFVIPIVKYGVPALSALIVGWLKGRAGRKAEVEFFADGRPKKIVAATSDEIVAMLEAVRRDARAKPKNR